MGLVSSGPSKRKKNVKHDIDIDCFIGLSVKNNAKERMTWVSKTMEQQDVMKLCL